MSQPILFYSKKCSNCSQVMQTLQALNKTPMFRYVEVETIPRNQIPPYLKVIPTVFVPETQTVIETKNNIFSFISKPTNSRKENPVKGTFETASSEYTPFDYSFTKLGESYSLWDSPTSFTNRGGSLFTFLEGSEGNGSSAFTKPVLDNGASFDKGDVSSRLEALTKQRESEFSGVARK